MLVNCAAKKGSEVLTVPNIETDSAGVSDDFCDFEPSVLSTAMPVYNDAVFQWFRSLDLSPWVDTLVGKKFFGRIFH